MFASRASEAATLSALLESLPGPALLVDLKRRVRAVNAAFRARIPGLSATRDAHCFELLHGRRRRCSAKAHPCPLDLCVGSGAPVVAFHSHVTGRRTGLEQALLRPLVGDDGKVVACLATLEPIEAGVTDLPRIPGKSQVAVAAVEARLPRLASGKLRILLVGEAGTGKASVARAIHRLSGSRGPFEERSGCELTAEGLRGLLEGTSAGGTLYVSDLQALDRGAQDALWEWLARSAGGPRLILGTDRDLAAPATAGTFRADLLARLASTTVRLPPLRERLGELAGIAARLLREAEGPGRTLSPEALGRLRQHSFPGNLDELAQALRHASVMAAGPVVGAGDLPDWLGPSPTAGAGSSPRGRTPRGSIGR
jgi:transcriptional regulator of acetoin/glycerol metabolism